MKKIIFALVALLGIVACEEQPPVDQTQSLLISADKLIIVADGNDTTTFTVTDEDKNEVNATIIFADTKEALEGNTFKTNYAGNYVFYAKYGDKISHPIGIVATEPGQTPEPEPEPGVLQLSVDNKTIDADGEAVALFTATLDGEAVEATIYNAADDTALEGKTFSTETPGIYTFYAKYKELTSNTVEVTAKMKIVEEEKPITIEATTDSIKANGIDAVKFIVIQDGANVTDKATIYVNGGVLNGNKFVTTTPGTYTIYATKGNQTSNEITITAEEVATGKTIVFAEGVTLTSGWYDVNKVGQGDNGDINMCWAATCSNMIQWFQDRYKAAGNTLPPSAVDGPGKTPTGGMGHIYELALMEMFWNEWDNSRGGHIHEAVTWYFEGHLNGGEYASAGSQATPKSAGGYWKSIWEDVEKSVYTGYENIIVAGVIEYPETYTTSWNNYYLWGNGTNLEGVERLAKVSELIVEAFDHGMASLTINLSENMNSVSHAVTLWGYEIDNATGLVTRLWITDSDDLINSGYKEPLLNEYSVSIGEGKTHVKLTGNTRYGACYIQAISPLAGYDSAVK